MPDSRGPPWDPPRDACRAPPAQTGYRTRRSTPWSCCFLLPLVRHFSRQSLDARRMECDGPLAPPAVVVDTLDQQVDDPGLLAWGERFPDRAEGLQGKRNLMLVQVPALAGNDLLADLR